MPSSNTVFVAKRFEIAKKLTFILLLNFELYMENVNCCRFSVQINSLNHICYFLQCSFVCSGKRMPSCLKKSFFHKPSQSFATKIKLIKLNVAETQTFLSKTSCTNLNTHSQNVLLLCPIFKITLI